MSINPINPYSSDYSNTQGSNNDVSQQLIYSISTFETFMLAILTKTKSQDSIAELNAQIEELRRQTNEHEISPSAAASQLQNLIQQLNELIPVQDAYPLTSPPYGADAQLQDMIAFLNVVSPDSPLIGQTQEILNQLNNGSINQQQAMSYLVPIISQLQNTSTGYPIPKPLDYPT